MTKKHYLFALVALIFFSSVQAKNYIVGSTLGSEPYLFSDESGLPQGFDADIIQAIAKDQSLDYEIYVDDFDSLFPSLDEGKIDLIIAGVTITPERQEKYDFTKVYITDYRSILYLKPENAVSEFSELVPLRVAAFEGSLDYDLLEKIGGKPIVVKSNFIGLKKLVQGKIDVIVGDENVLRYFIKQHPEISVQIKRLKIDENNPANPMGILVKKGNKELLDRLNKGLENIRKSGEYDGIVEKWL